MKKNVVLIILIVGVVVAIAWSAYRFWDTTMQGAPEKIQETISQRGNHNKYVDRIRNKKYETFNNY